MAAFDFSLFNSLLGAGTNPVTAVGTAFGLPSCILQLGLDALGLLPTSLLAALLKAILAGMRLADGALKAIFGKIRDFLGYIGILDENGEFVFLSKIFGALGDNDLIALIGGITGFIAAIGATAGNLYANYQNVADAIRRIKECLESFKESRRLQDRGLGEQDPMDPEAFQDFVEGSLAIELIEAESALNFINDANRQAEAIRSIIRDRRRNPSLEPQFVPGVCEFFANTPFAANCPPPPEATTEGTPEKPILRLTFGPPKASMGQFILSQDGLYFDSQTSGIAPVLTYLNQKKSQLDKGDLWRFLQDPNLGGRGKSFSTKDLNLYFNTLLDPDSINDSEYLKVYYDNDGFLQDLLGNKNKRIYDLSAQIHDLESDNAPLSIIFNLKQSLISENNRLLEKINKRKKQIELAIVLPSIYQTGNVYPPGSVPINDFSYLAGTNIDLDIQKQKALSFSQVEISGVVSPIELQNIYVETRASTRNSSLEHLILAENGDGAIIFDGSSVSSVDGLVLQTENSLTTEDLFAMYNFLDTDIVVPSSTQFLLRNSASIGGQYYAQLVANNPEDVFSRGLGIPYLQGITKQDGTTTNLVSGLGSYVRLPDAKPFNDLLYSPKGASIDFWVYMPNIKSDTGVGNVSSLYRLILANENTGSELGASVADTEYVPNDFGTNTVRGFLMGFTRDRRITKGLYASNSNTDNHVSSTVFFIAPTQSTSISSVSLVNRSSFDGLDCRSTTKYHSMKMELSGNLENCSSTFCHFAVTFDPYNDKISMYFDGSLITTSSMSYVFGISPNTMPNLPTGKKPNSFFYNTITVNSTAPTSLKSGPVLDPVFTPWIVGGGFTDGYAYGGNFLGGIYGGIISGLRGRLGSIKFYSKPLEKLEVLNNYNTHKNFFKNIDTSKL
jgi:hypothetical protein